MLLCSLCTLLISTMIRALCLLALTAPSALAAYCSGSPDEGTRTNENPISDQAPVFLKSGVNASLYQLGEGDSSFPVVHVWGNAYETGYAQGVMQKEYMRQFLAKTYDYFLNLVVEELPGPLPPLIQDKIILLGLNGALDWCAEVTAPYTPQEFYDELQGCADGAGVDYQTLLRLNMFAEITKASCSFFGAWGSATSDAEGTGNVYQLRALDYDTDGPFKDFPQITVYHPSEEGASPFANVGWPGSIGVLSGFNSHRMGISEIGASFADDSFGQGTDDTPPEKVRGEPWMFILRDVLKYQTSMDDAITYIEEADRTCNLILGIGDGEAGIVNGIEYSGYVAIPYNDSTLIPVNDTWHWPIDGVVYNGMDWNCPGYNEKLAEQLDFYHGHITEVNTIHDILPTVQTGNLHIVVYDLTAGQAHISFMRKSYADESEPLYAYERQFNRVDMDSLFAVKLE